jgi:hypothetical protein
VATHEGVSSIDDVVTQVYGWNERKKQFTPRQIRLGFDALASKGWLAAA